MAFPRRDIWLFTLFSIALLQPAARSQTYEWKEKLAGTGYSVGIDPYDPGTAYAQGLDGGLYVTRDTGSTWSYLSNPGIPDVRQIIVHPSDTRTLFAVGFSSGLQRSTDGGLTWAIVIPNFGIDGESVGLDPAHPDTMYAGNYSDGNIFRSTDRGSSWQLKGSTGGWICAVAVRPDSSNILYAGTGNGVVSKSTDEGATWRAVKPGGSEETPRIVFDRSNPLIAYATAFSGADSAMGLWKTSDGGEHWTLLALHGISVWSLDVDQIHPSTLYVGTFSPTITTVYRTTDGGASWVSLPAGLPPGTDMWNIKVHPLDHASPWLALANVFSTPSGVFRLEQSRAEIAGAVLDSATGDTIRNGFIRLSSTGETVNLATTGGKFDFAYFDGDPSLTPTAHCESYPYYIADIPLAFVLDSTRNSTLALKRLATASISGTVRDSSSLQPLSARAILTVTTSLGTSILTDTTTASGTFEFPGLYVTQQPVNQYTRLVIDAGLPHTQAVVSPVVLDTSGFTITSNLPLAELLVIAESDSGTFAGYYRDALDSLHLKPYVWNTVYSGPAPVRRAQELSRNTVIFYTGNRKSPLPTDEIDSLAACLNAGCNLLLTGQNIVKGSDSSSLFLDELGTGHIANTTLATATGAAGDLFDGFLIETAGGSGANNQTEREVLRITGSMAHPTWMYGLSNTGRFVAGTRIDSSAGRGRALVLGFGFESISTASSRAEVMRRIMGYFQGTIVVGIRPTASPEIPEAFRLEQNYPNPFNPSTTIAFEVPGPSVVRLMVFDILGREVVTLLNEERPAGRFSVRWDGSNSLGGKVGSGVYLYKLEARTVDGGVAFTSVKKAVLIR